MLATTCLYVVSLLVSFVVNERQTTHPKYLSGDNTDYDAAVQFLWEHDAQSSIMTNKGSIANWNYESNLTEENKKTMLKVINEKSKFRIKSWKSATKFAWKDFKDRNATVYRWFRSLSVLGDSALPEKKFKKLNQILADTLDTYGKVKICSKNDAENKSCDLSLEPEITDIFESSRDYDELKKLWNDWRAATGKKIRTKFLEYISLTNEAAKLNGFNDAGEIWRATYDSNTFVEDVKRLWEEVEPFYKELHAFVRRKLIKTYSGKGIKPNGPIPAHLLGNMWAQNWENIFPIVKPFPKKKFMDVSKTMREKKMKPLDMFKMSEEFFLSIGLKPMTQEFWNRSIIEKPKDVDMICHASAWDFSNGKDFRIKMCTKVNMGDLVTVHHEMGHIQYYQQYAHQPQVFRDGANPAFHEAIGDVLALSVSTPNHLKKVGLHDCDENDYEAVINNLMQQALSKVMFLPYGYVLDLWRWKVFSGEISEDSLNSKWWEMRLKYQGLCPPVKRTNKDLDAAAKYHVVADVPYIRYFLSNIIQFQFHKALCDEAGHDGPFHNCDIYKNKDAGKLLSETLSLGSSVPWTEAMKVITRGKTNKADTQPLLLYFEPLMKWLKKENEKETIGWESTNPMMCP